MIVAIPMDAMKRVYHQNPCTATTFDLYEISGDRQDMRYRYLNTRLNPWEKSQGNMVCDPVMKNSSCELPMREDPHHVSEHYALLEAIGKCDILIVDQYCLNTLYAMRNVGIKIHKIPPFIKNPSAAIEHFIIASEMTNNLQHIQQLP